MKIDLVEKHHINSRFMGFCCLEVALFGRVCESMHSPTVINEFVYQDLKQC
jgi:hypothetical protein